MKDYFSVWIIPKDDAPPKILSIERKKFKRALAIAGIVLLTGLFMFGDYVSLLIKRKELDRLRQENSQLKNRLLAIKKDSEELEKKLKLFEDYAKKLNTIAGLESPYALKEVGGVGGGEFTISPPAVSRDRSAQLDIGKLSSQLTKLKKKAQNLDINFDILYKFFKEQQELLACTPSIWPTRGYLTSVFGYRRDPFTGRRAFHKGIDISAPIGQKVHVTAKGIVVKTGYLRRSYGKYVMVNHGFGFTTVYGHLSRVLVKPGQRVKRGDVIGFVGNTGKSTAPHLHYEVRVYGRAVNPLLYILENLGI